MTYDLAPIKVPRLAGGSLRAACALVESSAVGGLVLKQMQGNLGIERFRATATSAPIAFGPPVPRVLADDREPLDLAELAGRAPEGEGFRFESAVDFHRAYREGLCTPLEVAERVIAATKESQAADPAMSLFIAQDEADVLRQAEASARRWAEGAPLGPLDGVPVAVKDEVDQEGYPTTVGTRFLGRAPARSDATVVARLRAQGALLIGKANMHELGIGVTGLNPHHGTPRNPYDPARHTGGSSSGSGAAVAAGLCPIAVAADGGGSIRQPAALCGVFGLKPTFGRVSEHGAAPLCWSVAHLGPIAATALDCALGYAVMAGKDDRDPQSQRQPPPDLDALFDDDLRGLSLGVYAPWFEDADPEVVSTCKRMLDALCERGAVVKEIEIPNLDLLRVAHLVTIAVEMATSQLAWFKQHRGDYGADVRMNLALARALPSSDYVHAQRHRSEIAARFAALLKEVDVICTPTTACTAPLVPKDALSTGESNLPLLGKIMRYAPAANFTGLPAITMPAGYDEAGLPIGFQIMGRPWQESLLLRLARVAEEVVLRREPRFHRRLLA